MIKKILPFLLFFNCLLAFGQSPSYVFHQLSVKDGLSEGTVRAIVEDKRGFMWFGTEDGLNKYDGYKFTVYKTEPNDSFSISSNNTKCFYNAPNGDLWIGTRNGVNIYDHIQERFYNFHSSNYSFLKYLEGDIESIFQDNKGSVWVLTSTHGLYKVVSYNQPPVQYELPYDAANSQFVSIAIDHDHNFLIGSYDGLVKFDTHTNTFEDLRDRYGRGYQSRALYLDPNNKLWLATTEGLKRIDLNTGKSTSFHHDPTKESSIIGNNTIRILPEGDQLLIAIDGSGIDRFNPLTEEAVHFNKNSGSQLNSNNITAIYKDSKGTLWAGTFLNGVNFSNSATNLFVMVKNNTSPSESVREGVVTSFLKDTRGNFWISTDGGGLNLKKKGTDLFINYEGISGHSVVKSPAVIGLLESSEGDIWVATYAGGVSRIKPSGVSTTFLHDPNNPSSLAWNKTKALCEHLDKIWISSYGQGLSVYNKKTNSFKRYQHNPKVRGGIPSDWVYWIMKDSQNTLWLATFQGLCRYLPEKDEFKTYQFNVNGHTVDKNFVFDIFEDSKHHLWLGTNGGGLVLFDRTTETFTSYTTENGLSDNAVRSIIEDRLGCLWLATNNGITKFDLTSLKGVPYKINDGLPSGSFFYDSKYLDEKGAIYFGMNDGYLIIDPALSTVKTEFPLVVLTELRLFNTPIGPRSAFSPLKKNISEADEITLSYDQNSLSFEFAALNFTIPRHNYYAYQLEGFDKEWTYAGKGRIAKYTNLDPGKYILRIKASNNEKEFGTASTDFIIVITPPFWSTWWFETLTVCIVGASLFAYFYLRTKNIRERNKWLADQVNERTLELTEANKLLELEKDHVVEQSGKILEQQTELLDKKHELEKNNAQLTEWGQFQNRLIGILGHDIRGPLQNFSLLLQLQDEQSEAWIKQSLRETADSLSLLATDLLSWVSLQSQLGTIEKTDFHWQEVIEKVQKQLQAISDSKKLVYSIQHKGKNKVMGVPPIVLACLRNIVSNSVRYSPVGGVIEMETGIKDTTWAYLRITDFGKGFNPERINKLIQGEAFSGVKDSNMKESAGLGMAICYDMIKRTGGHIEAATLPGTGATFYIYLPISEVKKQEAQEILPEQLSSLLEDKTKSLKGKTLLLVDDDDQLRWNTAKLLGEYLEIKEVRSSEEALEWLQDHTPDMALLDIHMKGISGIELCRQIKNSSKTAHVPCTILSGDNSEETHKELLSAGSDTFIAKPFKIEDLLIHIANYFENQSKKMHRFFQEELAVSQLAHNPLNQQFLTTLLQLVEDNLTSETLNVDFLAKETGLNRTSFYRKLKSLTGQSANDFIKNVRMRKALALIREQNHSISEIAAKTGFFSPSYFTTQFKKHFGYSPSDMKKAKT